MRIEISENQNMRDLKNFIDMLGNKARVEKEGDKFYLVLE